MAYWVPGREDVFAGRYRIVGCIKAGGMGAVYEVEDLRTESRRALKLMHPSLIDEPELRKRFEREVRAAGRVESDHVVVTLDGGVDEVTRTPFLVMELLRGEEMGSLIKRRGPLPLGEVVTMLRQAAMGLDRVHAAGLVHRDMKPDNLFVAKRDDGTMCVKILDFGVAKSLTTAGANATHAIGTPIYMPTEQMTGTGTLVPQTDLYALGHITYALLAGEPYWKEEGSKIDTLALCLTISQGLPELATVRARRRSHVELPPAFDAWFARATAAAPADRFSSGAEMTQGFEAMVGMATPLPIERPSFPGFIPPKQSDLPIIATATGVPVVTGFETPTAKARLRTRRLWIAGAATGVTVLAVGLVVASTLSRNPAAASSSHAAGGASSSSTEPSETSDEPSTAIEVTVQSAEPSVAAPSIAAEPSATASAATASAATASAATASASARPAATTKAAAVAAPPTAVSATAKPRPSGAPPPKGPGKKPDDWSIY